MSGQGSTANVIAALASFFIPGLGQLIQGRLLAALFFFIFAVVIHAVSAVLGFLTFGLLYVGWIAHIIAAIEAAIWKRR